MPAIGRSVERMGGVERVTGAQQYTADLHMEHALQVKMVYVDCAHARIDDIDISAALKVDGVRHVLTARDFGAKVPKFGPTFVDRPVIADRESRFFGEAVAAVAAETEDAAEAAASLVKVHYTELPAVLTVDQALAPDAPLVRDPADRKKGDPLATTNVLEAFHFGWGDVESATTDLVVEHDYEFPMVTHFAIEPHAYLAAPDPNGVTVWSPIQHPFILQRVVAAALGWPVARVRIIAPDPGGGFGGKGWPKFEPLLAYLALKTNRPVRLVLSLEETFQAVRRTACSVHARTGFDSNGRIVFQDLEANFLIGVYADIGSRVVSKASYAGCGPYLTPHARVIARAVLSHTTPSTAFRGFGTPQASWAVESQLNEAADLLGVDRLEIRRRNLPNKGQAFIPNDTPCDGEWKSSLDKVSHLVDWSAPCGKNRGRGIALGIKASSTASTSFALARLHFDGSATVIAGTSDMGQGARTVLAQIASQELGVPTENVAMVMGDTAVVPFDTSTSASRSTVFMGNAVLRACQHIKTQLKTAASQAYNVPEDRIVVGEGTVKLPDREVTFLDVIEAHFGPPRGEFIGVGEIRNAQVPGHPLGGSPAFWEFMCAAAEIELDPETGMVRILKIGLVSDVGKALNPSQVEGQDEGSAVMGIGHTLMEHIILDEHGRIRNLGAMDYRIPTIQDIPFHFESEVIENADGPGPYGAKGAGEGGILAIAAAIGSAINQAAGVRIRDLPLTPERIWQAIHDKPAAIPGGELAGVR